METLILWNDVKSLIPKETHLYYVDYNDSLDNSYNQVQECIHQGNYDALYCLIEDWDNSYSIRQEKHELKKTLINKLNLSDDEADEIMDFYDDEITEIIQDRDSSEPIDDLIKNTSKFVYHYDTRYEIPKGSWNWNKRQIEYEKKQIKKALNIHGISKWDNEIRSLILNSDGGQLHIYFQEDINSLIKCETEGSDEDSKSVIFRGNVWVGIVNHCNGSGDVEDFHGVKIHLPFNRENIFIEETIKYNWTYSIAGMVRNWCESTIVEFSTEEIGEAEKSETYNHLEEERKYNETYRSGICTLGDMDIHRHRNTTYENGFPAGTRCKNCGNFWID